jgi:hypothetical protein
LVGRTCHASSWNENGGNNMDEEVPSAFFAMIPSQTNPNQVFITTAEDVY